MAKQDVVLFMTIGTGFGPDGHENLAKGLFSSIRTLRPDFIVFFPSEGSMKTIPFVKEFAEAEYGSFQEGEDYKIVVLPNIDDFVSCFEIFERELFQYNKDNKINIEYTSGTKTMCSAMATLGVIYREDIIAIEGKRVDGLIVEGTGTIKHQNLYKIYDKMELGKIKGLFNDYRFTSAISFLEEIVDPDLNKNEFIKLSEAYYAWDNVDFDTAYEILTDVDMNIEQFKDVSDSLKDNLVALGNVCNTYSENLRDCYILASLINNSKRRAEEDKFDDAIARLYRSFEFIGQNRLKKYGVNTGDVDIDLLEEKGVSKDFLDALAKTEDDGKIKIGLIKDFKLLNELDDELGKYFMENENLINDLTHKRNDSILAHGLKSLTEDDFDKFEKVVVDLAKKFDRDMSKFLEETKFVQFDV